MSDITQRFPSPLKIAALNLDDPRMKDQTEGQQWELLEAFSFRSCWWGTITVPKGYVTNFASVPKAFHNLIDDDDPVILSGSVIHDYLYTRHGGRHIACLVPLSRQECDDVLCEAMAVCGAARWQIWAVRTALRWFGQSHWGDV